MSFNPSFPDQYKPTSTQNVFDFVDNVVQYSTSNDVIGLPGDNSAFPEAIRGKYVLLHDGADEYYGTDFDSSVWDNIANGNKGSDFMRGLNNSRDFLRGGKDDDNIWGREGGNDFVLGDAGDDLVYGSLTGENIVRGGKGNDLLVGYDKRDLLVGDFGKDELRGNGGSDLFVLRTDTSSSSGLSNLSANAAEVDVIQDFDNTEDDYVVLTGISSTDQISLQFSGADIFIKVIQPDFTTLYAGKLTAPVGFDKTRILVGDTADRILAAASGDTNAFGIDPTLLNTFGI